MIPILPSTWKKLSPRAKKFVKGIVVVEVTILLGIKTLFVKMDLNSEYRYNLYKNDSIILELWYRIHERSNPTLKGELRQHDQILWRSQGKNTIDLMALYNPRP